MKERERKHERAPLCLHQIEKVSFSGEKCCTSLSLPMSYRGVGMLLITRESEGKIPLLCLHGRFNYFFSPAKCFLDSHFLSAEIQLPQMSFLSYVLSAFMNFHKGENVHITFNGGKNYILKWLCCIYSNVVVILWIIMYRNHISHMDRMVENLAHITEGIWLW